MKIEEISAYRHDDFSWRIVVQGRGLQNKGRINKYSTESHKEKNEQKLRIDPITDGDFYHYIKQAYRVTRRAFQLPPQKEGHNKMVRRDAERSRAWKLKENNASDRLAGKILIAF